MTYEPITCTTSWSSKPRSTQYVAGSFNFQLDSSWRKRQMRNALYFLVITMFPFFNLIVFSANKVKIFFILR